MFKLLSRIHCNEEDYLVALVDFEGSGVFTLGIQPTVSVEDLEQAQVAIYPNPVDGNYVTIQSPVQGLKEIEVYTVTGRKVLQTVLTDDKLNVSSFNSGFYMVKVTINGQSKLSKLVVR